MDKSAKVFIERANERMLQLGINKSDLARRLKVAPGNVSRYLSGEISPGVEQLSKYAKALECEISFLTGAETTILEVEVKRTKFEIAAEMLRDYLPQGDRADAALLLLTCNEETLEGVLGGLRPFIKRARKAENLSSG